MRRFETFSFLPPLTSNQVHMQAQNMLAEGQVPMIEFSDAPTPEEVYWKIWPIPEHKEVSASWVMTQVDACSRRFPYSYVKLSGFDPKKKTYGQSFLVKIPLEMN
ncbi:MAG: ribulose bisphosphate carboxylase small subunit [Pseudomonadota bacterium]|nr:ribulose bisphosphate carboxylase small subunit [Pseudomonadota bacterium]